MILALLLAVFAAQPEPDTCVYWCAIGTGRVIECPPPEPCAAPSLTTVCDRVGGRSRIRGPAPPHQRPEESPMSDRNQCNTAAVLTEWFHSRRSSYLSNVSPVKDGIETVGDNPLYQEWANADAP